MEFVSQINQPEGELIWIEINHFPDKHQLRKLKFAPCEAPYVRRSVLIGWNIVKSEVDSPMLMRDAMNQWEASIWLRLVYEDINMTELCTEWSWSWLFIKKNPLLSWFLCKNETKMPILPSETWHTPDMTDLFNRFSNLRERREKSEYKETERSGIISASSNYHVKNMPNLCEYITHHRCHTLSWDAFLKHLHLLIYSWW